MSKSRIDIPARKRFIASLFLFGLLLKLLPGKGWQGTFCLFLLLLSLAVCPIYTDLSLTVPAVDVIRHFLPPWWLWAAVG